MLPAESITSPANPLLKDIRQAVARGALTSQGWCVAETFHLLEEALRSDCEVKVVVAAEAVRQEWQQLIIRGEELLQEFAERRFGLERCYRR